MIRRVIPGERRRALQAEVVNTVADLQPHVAKVQSLGGFATPAVQAGDRSWSLEAAVANATGGAIDAAFAVLAIESPSIEPEETPATPIDSTTASEIDRLVRLEGTTPSGDDPLWCIAAGPVADGAIVTGVLQGLAWAEVDVVTETDTHATTVDGETTHLTSATSGRATIVWKQPGTGRRWVLVELGGGGGEVASGSERIPVVVLEDIAVGEVGPDAERQTCEVDVLDCVWGNHGLKPDLTRDIYRVPVGSLCALKLSSTDCSGGGVMAPTGIRITGNIGADGNNRVYDNDATQGVFAVSGMGVVPGRTVTVTVGTLAGVTAIADSDGRWSATGIDVTSLSAGYLKVSATDGATTESVGIYYAADDNTTDLNLAPPQPIPLVLRADSDTGVRGDGKTTDTTPAFDARCPIDTVDLRGPGPAFLIDGEEVTPAETVGVAFWDENVNGGLTRVLSPLAALSPGWHTFQLSAFNAESERDYHGPPSRVVRVEVTAADPTDNSSVRYHRGGYVEIIAGRLMLTDVHLTPVENTEALNALIDNPS